jgi:hypothetical protein
MATRCSICKDPRSQTIDAQLAAGRSARSIALEYRLGDQAMQRHARLHTSAPTDAPVASGKDPLEELAASLRLRALAGSDSAARELRLVYAAQAERGAAVQVAYDVRNDPEFRRLLATMTKALWPFPEARLAIADALRAEIAVPQEAA